MEEGEAYLLPGVTHDKTYDSTQDGERELINLGFSKKKALLGMDVAIHERKGPSLGALHFHGAGANTRSIDESPPLHPCLLTVSRIRAHVERALRRPVNHVLIQLYRTGWPLGSRTRYSTISGKITTTLNLRYMLQSSPFRRGRDQCGRLRHCRCRLVVGVVVIACCHHGHCRRRCGCGRPSLRHFAVVVVIARCHRGHCRRVAVVVVGVLVASALLFAAAAVVVFIAAAATVIVVVRRLRRPLFATAVTAVVVVVVAVLASPLQPQPPFVVAHVLIVVESRGTAHLASAECPGGGGPGPGWGRDATSPMANLGMGDNRPPTATQFAVALTITIIQCTETTVTAATTALAIATSSNSPAIALIAPTV
ncbi:hypothetical protein EDB84DRAFT_1440267 [Lactarius hengduanensis]|nr:hypothetical protein EDB84DRAFT_1440267 [Lactarius hengduanensis]